MLVLSILFVLFSTALLILMRWLGASWKHIVIVALIYGGYVALIFALCYI